MCSVSSKFVSLAARVLLNALSFNITRMHNCCEQIVNLGKTEEAPLEVSAHDGPITCLALNVHGTKLATASDKVSGW